MIFCILHKKCYGLALFSFRTGTIFRSMPAISHLNISSLLLSSSSIISRINCSLNNPIAMFSLILTSYFSRFFSLLCRTALRRGYQVLYHVVYQNLSPKILFHIDARLPRHALKFQLVFQCVVFLFYRQPFPVQPFYFADRPLPQVCRECRRLSAGASHPRPFGLVIPFMQPYKVFYSRILPENP